MIVNNVTKALLFLATLCLGFPIFQAQPTHVQSHPYTGGFHGRRNFKSYVHRCPKKEWSQFISRSQFEEDQKLLQWFNGLCNGTYLEMGALDGLTFSNSYLFNVAFQWKGVLLEIGPKNFQKLLRNRPNEIAKAQAAVCGKRQTIHYIEKEAVGGIWEFMSPGFRKEFHKNIDLNSPKVKVMECAPLEDILQEHAPTVKYFDFFSLDVEGAEFDVLQAINFHQIGFGIIFLEAARYHQGRNLAARSLLETKGYVFLFEHKDSYYFYNKNFWNIYKDVMYEG